MDHLSKSYWGKSIRFVDIAIFLFLKWMDYRLWHYDLDQTLSKSISSKLLNFYKARIIVDIDQQHQLIIRRHVQIHTCTTTRTIMREKIFVLSQPQPKRVQFILKEKNGEGEEEREKALQACGYSDWVVQRKMKDKKKLEENQTAERATMPYTKGLSEQITIIL